MNKSLLFSQSLAEHIRNPVTKIIDRREPGRCRQYQLEGTLEVPSRLVSVRIRVPGYFDTLRNKPPSVWCLEDWMRDDPDWHNSNALGMCWVLNEEWQDVIGCSSMPWRSVITEGVRLLLSNCTNLISRHHFGYLKDLKEWPPEWEAWGHYDEGPREYERSKGRRAR